MDPASAIGVASSVLAFVDFSWKLVAGTWEIYQGLDGNDIEDVQVEDVVEDFEMLTAPLENLGKPSPKQTTAERNIRRLARACLEDSTTIIELLSKMKVKGPRTVGKSFRATWIRMLNKGELSELKTRVQSHRQDILVNIAIMIQYGDTSNPSSYFQLQESQTDMPMPAETTSQRLACNYGASRMAARISRAASPDKSMTFAMNCFSRSSNITAPPRPPRLISRSSLRRFSLWW